MNHQLQGWMAGCALLLTAAIPALANAGDSPVRLAHRLEHAAASLEQEILHHFGHAPGFPHYLQAASQLRANACQARLLLESGAPASHVRKLANYVERDANRLEDRLEDIDYKRCFISEDCYNRAVRLADDCEDLADALGDELEDFGHRPVVHVAVPVEQYSPPVYRQQYVPALPLERVITPPTQSELLPPAPRIGEPVAPPLPELNRKATERSSDGRYVYEPIIQQQPSPFVPSAPEYRAYYPPSELPAKPEPKNVRQIRVGPIQIHF